MTPRARSCSPTSGCCASSRQAHAKVTAVVSCPASTKVMISSRSWRSLMPSPVSSSRASISMARRSSPPAPLRRRCSMMPSTTRSSSARARRKRRLRGVGIIKTLGKIEKASSDTNCSAASMARPTPAASPTRSTPNSACPTTWSVTRDVCSIKSMGVPSAAAFSHPFSIWVPALLMIVARPSMRWRWNAGCAKRRCRRQNSPSLVNRPSPMSGFTRRMRLPFQ